MIRLPERIVLPRLADAAESVRHLLGARRNGEGVELLVMDFKDAFKHLKVHPTERPFLSGTCSAGWFAYCTVLFGIVSGPLVWGRVAALVMRATQATLQDRGRMQCYVDDPLLAVLGCAEERSRLMLRAVLLWQALGLQLSWHKGIWGSVVEWIGAEITVDNSRGCVHLRVPESKRQRLAKELTWMSKCELVPRRPLRVLTGLVEWMCGVLPQLQPFAQQLWAAISSHGHSPKLVWRRQVQLAFDWLLAFTGDTTFRLLRTLSATPPASSVVIAFDASTHGGGAAIWIVPAHAISELGGVPIELPSACLSVTWTTGDEGLAQARIGDCGSQARWEAFALLLAIRTWRSVLLASRGPVLAIGDALGMMQGAVRFRSRDPAINLIFMEIAFIIGREGRTLEALHLWSQQNQLADDLSRCAEGIPMPDILLGVPLSTPPQGEWRVLARRAEQAPHPSTFAER